MPPAPQQTGPINFATGLNLQPQGKPIAPSFSIANAPANNQGAAGLLTADSRTKILTAVQKMTADGVAPDKIQSVVDFAKQKYAGAPNIKPPSLAKTAIGAVIQQAQSAWDYTQSGFDELADNSDLNAQNVRNAQTGGGPLAGMAESIGEVGNLLFHKAAGAGRVVGGAIGTAVAPITAATNSIGTPIGKAIANAIPDQAAQGFYKATENPAVGKYASDVLDLSNLALPKGVEGGTGLVKPTFTKLGEGGAAVAEARPHPIDALRGYADTKVKASIQSDVSSLLRATRSIGNKTAEAARTGTDIQKHLEDPQIFKGIKVEKGKINPNEAIATVESRIEPLLDAKSSILPKIDQIVPAVPRNIIRSKAVQFINNGKNSLQDKADAIDRMDKQLAPYPERMKPSEIDALRADMRGSARDAKGQLKSDSEYAALETAARNTVFDITDNLPVPNAAEYKALNDYVKQMIRTKDFLDKTLRNQTVKGGRFGGYSMKLLGAIAGSSHGPLGTIAGQAIGGVVADIITNNQLGSSFKMSLIQSLTDDPAILDQAQKLLGDINKVDILSRRALGPGAIRMGSGADKSGVEMNPAKKILPTANPQTGRMQKTYSQESQSKNLLSNQPAANKKTISPTTNNIPAKVPSKLGSVKKK